MKLKGLDTHKGMIQQLRLKIALLLALRYELASITIVGFLFGIVILVVRVIWITPRQTFLWALPAFIPITVWAVLRALRKTPSHETLCALFDEKNQCGGLLMAAEEVDLGGWRRQLPALTVPRFKWHGARTIGLSASAVLFVVISLFVPDKYVSMAAPRPLDIGEDIHGLQRQIDILGEENIISDQAAQELYEELERLEDTASAYDPVKTWEALDHLQQSITRQADEFAAQSLSQTENLAEAETLAQGLLEDAAALDPVLLSEAMLELSATVQSNARENELFKNSLGADCQDACKQGAFSAQQLEELLKAIRANKTNLSSRLAKLGNAKLVDPKTLKLCETLGTCNSKGLVAFLNENAGCMGMGNAVASYCQSPGKGGITRGRGDAPMTWTGGSSEENAAFQEQVLPPASVAALRDSMTVGLSISAPSVEENQGLGATGALDSATAGSGEAFSHTLLPRHRGVVQRYFETQ